MPGKSHIDIDDPDVADAMAAAGEPRTDRLPDDKDATAAAEAALADVERRMAAQGQVGAAKPAEGDSEGDELRHYRVFLTDGSEADYQCTHFYVEDGVYFFPEESGSERAQAAYSVVNTIGVVLMDGVEDEEDNDD